MTALDPPLTSYNAFCANAAPMKTGMAHLEMAFSTFGAAMVGDGGLRLQSAEELSRRHL